MKEKQLEVICSDAKYKDEASILPKFLIVVF